MCGSDMSGPCLQTRIMVALSSMRQRVNCRIFTEAWTEGLCLTSLDRQQLALQAQVQEVGKVLRRLHGKTEAFTAGV